MFLPFYLPLLGTAYVQLGQFDDAWRRIGGAMTAIETAKESWCEAEVHRTAGGLTLKETKPDTAKAQGYFERALAVARQQEVKSWEPRTAMSMARLWRDQGKLDEAQDLLAPVHNWFTEGFDRLDPERGQGASRRAARLTTNFETTRFVAVHEFACGPQRRLLRDSNTSGVGGEADIAWTS